MIQADWGPTPTDDENRELIRRAQAGDTAARQECVVRNTRLVIDVLKRFRAKVHEWDDLKQEGLMGLDVAVMRFDLESENKLSTYAYHWISCFVRRWRCNLRDVIRVPRYLTDGRHDPNKKPSDYCIRRAQVVAQGVASIDIRTEDGLSVGDNIPARDDGPSMIEIEEEYAPIRHALDCLEPRDRAILIDRFMLGKTLDQVGAEWKLTKERIRQIQDRAILRMREMLKESA